MSSDATERANGDASPARGLRGFDIAACAGLVALKGTPKEIVTKLNGAINMILKDRAFAAQITAIGIDPLGDSPGEFADYLRQEIPRWQAIVRDAGVKVE